MLETIVTRIANLTIHSSPKHAFPSALLNSDFELMRMSHCEIFHCDSI